MVKKFLDNTGLATLVSKIKGALQSKVDQPLEVAFTMGSGNTYTCDKTIAEIFNAHYNEGRQVNFRYDGYLMTPLLISSNMLAYYAIYGVTLIVIQGTTENGSDVYTVENVNLQAQLTFDNTPTASSTNPVTSDGIASKFNDYVTLDTNQNITGDKTFVGTKKIKFKKSTASDKLGFTLYDNNNKELSYLEYNSGDLCLGSYYQFPSSHVKSRAGFKMSDVSSGINAVYRILTPYAADAKTPFSLTNATKDFYFLLGVSNGTTTLLTNSTGLLDISSFFNNYYTKTDTDTLLSGKQSTLVSGTSIKTVNSTSLLGGGDITIKEPLVVTFTETSNGQGTSSHSLSQIRTAYNAGRAVLAKDDENICYVLRSCESAEVVFTSIGGGEDYLGMVYTLYNTGENVWYKYYEELQPKTDNIVTNEDPIGGSEQVENLELLNSIDSIVTDESTLSGGTNTVTITTTNGTVTTFGVKNGIDGQDGADGRDGQDGQDGQDGADGVSLGEIALVQTTGSGTDVVMSQNAVTEYGRKVTAEDLAGTSDWIKAKLTEEGWEFGKYINSAGNLANSTDYCASHYIPVSNVEGKSLTIYGGEFTNNNYCIFFYDANKTKLAYWWYTTKPRTFTVGTYSSTIAYIRMTCKTANIGNCYILNSITGEYIFKAEEYFTSFFKQNNLVIDAKFLEDTVIKQEMGESAIKTMSQKTITDVLKHNAYIEHGTSVNMNGTCYVKINEAQVTMLNNSDIMSIRFLIYGSDASDGGMDWRCGELGSTGTTSDVFVIRMHYSGKIIVGAGSKSATTDLLAGQPSSPVHPIIATVVMDRVRGKVSYYKNTTLITSETADKYKISKFIDTSGIVYFAGGDQNIRFYGVQFYDCDITKFWRRTYMFDNELSATLSEVHTLFKYYTSNHNLINYGSTNPSSGGWYRSSDYNIVENDKGTITLTRVDGAAGTFLWFQYLQQKIAYILEVEFSIDTAFHLSGSNFVNGCSATIYDTEWNEVATTTSTTASSSIQAGRYILRTYCAEGNSAGIVSEAAGATVTIYYRKYRISGCAAHFNFSALYDGTIYDDITKQFYTIYSNSTCTTVSTQHTLSQLPLRSMYQGNLAVPHYVGEIKITGGKAYIADNTWTWKQINNS